jgi:hypothetical protein
MEDRERPDQRQKLLMLASLLLFIVVAPLAVLLLWEMTTEVWNMMLLGARWLFA